jgi:molybdopterin molybdotransferase
VICLPGNPVAALVSFEVFVRPALRRAMGLAPQRQRAAVLATSVRSRAGRCDYLPGVVESDGIVRPVVGPGSHSYRSLASANCLIEVPESREQVADGESVRILRIGGQ